MYHWNEANPTRYYKGRYFEVLAYNRALSPDERVQAETYLQLKWLGGGLENVLPTNSLTLAEGAALDLGGTAQSFSSVAGAGSIVNGIVTVTDAVHVSVALDGTCTPFEIGCDLTLSGARLIFDHPEYLKKGQTVVICAGTLSGTLASGNLPSGWIISQRGNTLNIYPGGTRVLVH